MSENLPTLQPFPLRADRSPIGTFAPPSNPATVRSESQSVPQLVTRQATATPDACAVVAGFDVLTYAELDRRSNRLAHWLKLKGAGRERLVAVYLERSPNFLIAALAALKSGSAYLPLDPEWPVERLQFVLRDAGVRVVVSDETLCNRAPAGAWDMVNLEADRAVIAEQSIHPPEIEVGLQDVAYVIYTSGSTGQPKGVEIEHSSLVNLVAWHTRTFQVTRADRASMSAPLGFDAAVWESWPYLSVGASVHLPEQEVRNDATRLRDWLVEQKITVSFAATALAEQMLLLDWPSSTALRILLTGADTLRRRPSSALPFQLINNYGPTECTVVATSGVVMPGDAMSLPTIGRAIDKTTVYVLDEQMQPMPDGETGELYIGGAGVARGYRNRADLTTERFLPNPFGAQPGSYLYRTGDLGRVLPNGEIEFSGRVDEQVKIRGFRIEPNEIIAALNSYPAVRASAVVARVEQNGEKRLIAYVVPKAGAALTATALRDHISSFLPDYMIPAAFVELDTIFTTANGKVDRAVLPAPTSANTVRDECFVEPRSVVEQRLAALIGPLLHVEDLGVDDNFFLLGGHSLLGTQLISRIRESFGVDLSLLSLFDHPTVAGMAQEIERLILAKIELTDWEEFQPAAPPSDAGTQG